MTRSTISTVLLRTVVALGAIALLVGASIYGASEWMVRREHAIPLEPFVSLPTTAEMTEGHRLAILVGCLKGCHGPEGEGGKVEAPGVFKITAPPLSSVLPSYTDPELVRLVRFGVKRDGVSALGMPAGTFFPLGTGDLAQIIAHLRQLPPTPTVQRERQLEPVARIALVLGEWHTSADEVDASAQRWGDLPRTNPFERGRYLVSIVCAECHGLDLRGKEFLRSPPLTIIRAYDLEQFTRLMRTGELRSGKREGLMSEVARDAFGQFTEQEVEDIYTYLRERGEVQWR
jgi:cytochrome c553